MGLVSSCARVCFTSLQKLYKTAFSISCGRKQSFVQTTTGVFFAKNLTMRLGLEFNWPCYDTSFCFRLLTVCIPCAALAGC